MLVLRFYCDKRMMMQMVGSFAEFERAMIRERTSAGLAHARAEGRIGGRRPKLGDKQRREIAEMKYLIDDIEQNGPRTEERLPEEMQQ